MKLSKVALATKTVEVPYFSHTEFKVKIGFISRELQRKISADSTVSKYDSAMQVTTDEISPELFAENFTKKAVVGWSGLTPEILGDLILVDADSLREELGEATEVPFNEENALFLMRNCAAFDRWVTEQSSRLSTFRS